MLEVLNSKELLRKTAKEFRKNLSKSEKTLKDNLIFEKIVELKEYLSADVVLCYYSTEFEVDTVKLINYSLNIGKKVALPVCLDKSGKMEFRYIYSTDDLVDSVYGLKEPVKSDEVYLNDRKSICIIPALMVDKHKFRLGYGKGYYDRFLAEFEGTKCVICYKDNLVKELPVYDDFDIQCDVCITD